MSILDDIVKLIKQSSEFSEEEKEDLIGICEDAYYMEMEEE